MFMRHKYTLKSLWRDIAGAAALELALLTPFLLATVLILSDAGLATVQKMRLADVVQMGAQYGLANNPVSGNFSGIIAAIGPGVTGNNRTITVNEFCECTVNVAVACSTSCPDPNVRRRTYLSITVNEKYHTLVSYPILGPVVELTENAQIRIK